MLYKNGFNKNILIGCLCALGCETLFGLSYIFTKQATNAVSAFALLGWRFIVALVAMSLCVFAGIVTINLRKKPLMPLLIVALCTPVIYFIGETIGISRTTASESGAFLACIPMASLAASAFILHKKPSKRQLTGILITLAGVLLTVFAVGATASFVPVGYAMLLMAVISYALYSVFVAKAQEYTGAEITFTMISAGAIVFGILAVIESAVSGGLSNLIQLPLVNPEFRIAILYQGIGCSVIAFFLSNTAISKIGVNRTSSFIGVATVVSIVAGVIFLREHFSFLQAIGVILIIAGVYVSNY